MTDPDYSAGLLTPDDEQEQLRRRMLIASPTSSGQIPGVSTPPVHPPTRGPENAEEGRAKLAGVMPPVDPGFTPRPSMFPSNASPLGASKGEQRDPDQGFSPHAVPPLTGGVAAPGVCRTSAGQSS